MVQAAIGALVTPSRGLLIFTPIFLFHPGMVWARKSGWRRPLTRYLTVAVVAYWLLIVVYFRILVGRTLLWPALPERYHAVSGFFPDTAADEVARVAAMAGGCGLRDPAGRKWTHTQPPWRAKRPQ